MVVRKTGRSTTLDVHKALFPEGPPTKPKGTIKEGIAESIRRKHALDRFRRHRGVGFTDCLVLEITSKAGHPPLATFDRNLSKREGTMRL